MDNPNNFKQKLLALKKSKKAPVVNQSSQAELTIEEMGKRIAKSKKPKVHSFSNPVNGNTLY
ncbi:hypothetical protein [Candidatus Protochlamydia sp. W-9]|uniref:hypothetical protein n=1 Tax=Candidatus Protochlamydia sp. W-9 TaxID=1785087 RepID=UPI00096A22F2|nr:hypothetical protein [Candidatus Protochlamydia sp. W-9]